MRSPPASNPITAATRSAPPAGLPNRAAPRAKRSPGPPAADTGADTTASVSNRIDGTATLGRFRIRGAFGASTLVGGGRTGATAGIASPGAVTAAAGLDRRTTTRRTFGARTAGARRGTARFRVRGTFRASTAVGGGGTAATTGIARRGAVAPAAGFDRPTTARRTFGARAAGVRRDAAPFRIRGPFGDLTAISGTGMGATVRIARRRVVAPAAGFDRRTTARRTFGAPAAGDRRDAAAPFRVRGTLRAWRTVAETTLAAPVLDGEDLTAGRRLAAVLRNFIFGRGNASALGAGQVSGRPRHEAMSKYLCPA